MSHQATIRSTCVATKLRDELQGKLPGVMAPFIYLGIYLTASFISYFKLLYTLRLKKKTFFSELCYCSSEFGLTLWSDLSSLFVRRGEVSGRTTRGFQSLRIPLFKSKTG